MSRHGNLGWGTVAPIIWDGRHIDMVGGKRAEIGKGVVTITILFFLRIFVSLNSIQPLMHSKDEQGQKS